jgi:hypothetical protein
VFLDDLSMSKKIPLLRWQHQLLVGLIPTTPPELFDTHHRTLGIAVCYNIALALFGGTVPLMALTLIFVTNNLYTLCTSMVCGCVYCGCFHLAHSIKRDIKKTISLTVL